MARIQSAKMGMSGFPKSLSSFPFLGELNVLSGELKVPLTDIEN